MAKPWKKPYYQLKSHSGKEVTIDVTLSCSAGLPPNKAIIEKVVPFFESKDVERVLDFGCGAVRQSTPLLKAGFQVCAVEFEEQFKRPAAGKALETAKKNPNFSTLIYPNNFIDDNRKFDAALLCYVLQTMPEPDERTLLLKLIAKKLKSEGYIIYMSRYGQMPTVGNDQKVSDGIFSRPDDKAHSFYREFTAEETHEMFQKLKFKRIRSLNERGTDQIYVYAKGGATWI